MKDGEIMNENILAVCIPGNENELSLDFLFQSDDYKTISVKNVFQFECFLDDIDDISLLKQKNKIYYHIDHVKNYLKKNNERLSKKVRIDRFNPDQNFSCIVSGDEYNLENVKYNEILNFLDIGNQRKRM